MQGRGCRGYLGDFGSGGQIANWSPVDAGDNPRRKFKRRQENQDRRPKKRSRGRGGGCFPAAMIAVSLAILIWLMHRPLPPARIAGYSDHPRRARKILGRNGWEPALLHSDAAEGPCPGWRSRRGSGANPSQCAGHLLPSGCVTGRVQSSGHALEEGGSLANHSLDVGASGRHSPPRGIRRKRGLFTRRKSIAYTTDKGELWLVRSDGTGARKLASVGSDAANPNWSPDGSVIGFWGGHRRVAWEISSNGSNLRPSDARLAKRKCCGRWTPDGKFYLFPRSARPFEGDKIWALDERRGRFAIHPRSRSN